MRLTWRTTPETKRRPPMRPPRVSKPGDSLAVLVDLPHGFLDRLLHAERVGTLTWRISGKALQMRLQERPGRGRGPQFLRDELASGVSPFVRFGIHLFHGVHAQVEDVRHARKALGVPPRSLFLD